LEQEKKLAKEKKQKDNTSTKKDSPKKKVKKTKTKVTSEKKESTKELTEQLASEKDRVLRLSAEFENYKKRKERESDEFKKFANEAIFRQLLTVVDNLERAISSTKDDSSEDSLLEGVKLTYKEMIKLFETFNVKPVEADKQPFDPNFHQAVTQEETDELTENTVSKVLQKGYLLNNRLLRPAMVIVSKKIKKNQRN